MNAKVVSRTMIYTKYGFVDIKSLGHPKLSTADKQTIRYGVVVSEGMRLPHSVLWLVILKPRAIRTKCNATKYFEVW